MGIGDLASDVVWRKPLYPCEDDGENIDQYDQYARAEKVEQQVQDRCALSVSVGGQRSRILGVTEPMAAPITR